MKAQTLRPGGGGPPEILVKESPRVWIFDYIDEQNYPFFIPAECPLNYYIEISMKYILLVFSRDSFIEFTATK